MVHLFFCHWQQAPSAENLERWKAELPYNKSLQTNHLRNQQDTINSLLAWQLLKTGLQHLGFTDFRLSNMNFTTKGKPFSSRLPDFSLSHSGHLALCAIAERGSVGIDTEWRQRARIVERVLTPEEKQWVDNDALRFLELWVRKEATVKLRGTGIAEIRQVRLAGNRATVAGDTYYLQPVAVHPDYLACLASDQPECGLRIMEVPELVS